MTKKRNISVRSVERAIDILKCFSRNEPELGVAELGRRVGLPKSTVHRLLTTLESRGFISQNPDTSLYHLGVELIPLADSVFVYNDLRRLARPYLRNLVNSLEETASLNVLVDSDILILEEVEASNTLIVRAGGIKHRIPFHATSAGKVIAAFLPESESETLLTQPLPTLTSATITDPETLRIQFNQVRDQGYAKSFEELEIGLHAISAPISNYQGRVIACITVSGPGYRLTRSRIRELSSLLQQTADQISQQLGHNLRSLNYPAN